MGAQQKSQSDTVPDSTYAGVSAHLLRWWSAPAILTFVVLVLFVAGYKDGIRGVALWPAQHTTFLSLNSALAALPSPVWYGVTLLGDTAVLMLLLAPFLLYKPQAWAALLAAIPVGGLFSAVTKHWASMPRPAAVLADFNVIGPTLELNSFPSGHTITAFAAAAALLATLVGSPKRGGEWLLIGVGLLLALLICLSRIAVGAHWPLDLVAGAAGGWLAGLSGALLAHRTGWWTWVFFGPGRRVASLGLIAWGVLLWLRPHHEAACALVVGLAGLSGSVTGLLLFMGKRRRTAATND